MTDQVSRPYKTIVYVIVLCILIFVTLDSRRKPIDSELLGRKDYIGENKDVTFGM
jgi:hypothetical protein